MIRNIRALQTKAKAHLRLSLFLFIGVLALSSCSSGWQSTGAQGQTMGTYYYVQVAGPKGQLPTAGQVQRWSEAFFQDFSQSMSTYVDDSEITLINEAGHTDWLPVSDGLWQVLQVSQAISALSGGAFDITIMPLVNLWGFGPQAQVIDVPTDAQLQQARERIGYQKLELSPARQALRKPSGLTLDLSAVAKGFAADELADLLVSKGYSNVLVEIGGDLAVRGQSVRQTPWRIGIESPSYAVLSSSRRLAQAVELFDRGMATSGDYRNYYEMDGKRLSHTIDPATGHPVEHNLASVTVIADTCAAADAWATALNVLGPERARAMAKEQELAAYFIVREEDGYATYYSEAFERYIVD